MSIAQYIESLVSHLTANVDTIQQGRAPLPRAFQSENSSIVRLTQSSNRDLFPKISTSVDAQFYQLLGKTRVAVLCQNDSYGQDGLAGVKKALDQRDGMELTASWYYKRNTSAVQSAAYRIAEAEPEAVIIIGSYQPAAAAIQKLRMKLGSDTIFMNVSFVGSDALVNELGDDGEGVYVTQVVPMPSDTSNDAVRAYHDALSAYDPDAEPGFISLEGYLAERLAVARLQKCGPDVTRECLLVVFSETTSVDLSGLGLEFGPMGNQGSDDVFLTVICEDGKYHQVDELGSSN